MVNIPRAPLQPSALVANDLAEVRAVLTAIGQDDGSLLRQVIAALLALPQDELRPTVALLTAQALSGQAPRQVVRFAAAVQIVHAASLAHRCWGSTRTGYADPEEVDGENERVTVLAGDYLYAQAAVLTADLKHLPVMALLAEAIKGLCRAAVGYAATPAAPSYGHEGVDPRAPTDVSLPMPAAPVGLFHLSAAGVGHLLGCEPSLIVALGAYGDMLDTAGHTDGNARQPGTSITGRAAVRKVLQDLPEGAARDALAALPAQLVAHAGISMDRPGSVG